MRKKRSDILKPERYLQDVIKDLVEEIEDLNIKLERFLCPPGRVPPKEDENA